MPLPPVVWSRLGWAGTIRGRAGYARMAKGLVRCGKGLPELHRNPLRARAFLPETRRLSEAYAAEAAAPDKTIPAPIQSGSDAASEFIS